MAGIIDWVESTVLNEIDTTFSATFALSEKTSSLELQRLPDALTTDPEEALWTGIISNATELEAFADKPDRCQIFCVRQKHSYARLNLTRDIFEQLLSNYSVFSRMWDFLVPFSFKTRESDLVNAPFRFRQLEFIQAPELGSFECAYGFRYVELNNRTLARRENPDYDPWSVRQSAVYQRYDRHYNRIMFILIAPSNLALHNLIGAIRNASMRCGKLNAFDLHRILISTLHENWRQYVRSLESLMTQQSERVVLAQVENSTVRLSPLTDFEVNFVDRQRLKMIEDKVLDLVIIFQSIHNTLSKLKRQCETHCLGNACINCTCANTVEELDEQMHEVEVNLKKVDILHKRAQGTAQLLSDLLDYENAQIAHSNEKALNGLVKETKDENSKMRILTERSTADAAANFFSSQLVQVNEKGRISVVAGSYWFAVISIPLTAITFIVWKWWLMYSIRSQERKQVVLEGNQEKSETHKRTLSWPSSWRHAAGVKNRRGNLDQAQIEA